MLQGPVKAYFDVENFDKNALESQIEEDLATMRQAYKQTNKFLVSAFQDLIKLSNCMQGLSKKQIKEQLAQVGISKNISYVCD